MAQLPIYTARRGDKALPLSMGLFVRVAVLTLGAKALFWKGNDSNDSLRQMA